MQVRVLLLESWIKARSDGSVYWKLCDSSSYVYADGNCYEYSYRNAYANVDSDSYSNCYCKSIEDGNADLDSNTDKCSYVYFHFYTDAYSDRERDEDFYSERYADGYYYGNSVSYGNYY